ncbi:MAG: gamma-glutamyltransferase [Proteobacteria bacterium]|nr:gamma-glutamyltransferase [Pseudomonadota bacterium]
MTRARPDTKNHDSVRATGPFEGRVAASRQGMASTARDLATEAAVRVLADGGNAVDAAVTAALALSVCEPSASGLGGQTVVTLYLAAENRVLVLDGSSRPPRRAVGLRLTEDERFTGHQATTVPSTPATLAHALDRWGTIKWSAALEPALALAEEGYPVTGLQHALTAKWADVLGRGPAGLVFLEDGRPRPVGAKVRQAALANTLRRLAEAGVEDLYEGDVARRLCRDMAAHHGLIEAEDLADIPWPTTAEPVTERVGDWDLFSYGSPGAGRTLLEMYRRLRTRPMADRDLDAPHGALLLAETIRQVLLGRHDMPSDRRRALTGGHTTHLSVMDVFGNAVSLTQSLERVYGARTMCPELGFLYNNYMGSFEYDDPTHPHYLRPGAVPWAQVAPTIVLRSGRPWLAIGSPGSNRIAPSIVQVLLRLERGSPLEAVVAPRLHCSIDGEVSLEAARMDPAISRALIERGYRVNKREPFSFFLGCVQLVLRQDEGFIGVADPRRDGVAGGPTD